MSRRKKSWNMSNPLYRYLHSRKHAKKRGVKMARRRRSYRSRGMLGGFGRVLSVKNIAFTLAGMYLLPRVLPVDSKIGGAVGGYFGAGVPGAVVGYVAPAVVPSITSLAGGKQTPVINAYY